MIRGNCPLCGRIFKVDDRFAGLTGKCKSCGGAVTIPGEPDDGLDGLPPMAAGAEPTLDAPQPPPSPGAFLHPLPVTPPPVGPPATPPPTGAPWVSAPAPQPPPGPAQAPQPAAPVADDPPAEPPPVTPPPLWTPRPGPFEPPSPVGGEPVPMPAERQEPRPPLEAAHGPTAFEGHWLAQEPGATARRRVVDTPAPPRPPADDVLRSSRIITPVGAAETPFRPTLVKLVSGVLALLGLGFCGRFIWEAIGGAGVVGAAIGAIGLALAALSVWRIWTGHWDGLVPAALFVLIVFGGALLLASAAAPDGRGLTPTPSAIALLAGGGLAVVLLLLTAARSSCRDHLTG